MDFTEPLPSEITQMINELRLRYPHGHEQFIPISVQEIALHSVKNHDYAQGGAALGNFDRVASILALYPGLKPGDRRLVVLTYMLKQLDAVLWGLANGIQHWVEGILPRLQDISVYTKILMCMTMDDQQRDQAAREAFVHEEFVAPRDLPQYERKPRPGPAPYSDKSRT